MHFHIISLFPDFFSSPFSTGLLGKALDDKLIRISYYHLKDFKESPSKRVDDTPFGGGAGMLFRPEPVALAIEHVEQIIENTNGKKSKHWKAGPAPVIHFTPRGNKLTQAKLEKFPKKYDHLILLCGRYEGIDQRVLDLYVDMEFCVGDVILTGGEYPALFFVDALTRLLPGVLGNEDSPEEESFSKALGRGKEYPHYTRPEEWRGLKVPEVLLSGHHKNIEKWRRGMVE